MCQTLTGGNQHKLIPLNLTTTHEGGLHYYHLEDENGEVKNHAHDYRASCWLNEGLKHRMSSFGVYTERCKPEQVT